MFLAVGLGLGVWGAIVGVEKTVQPLVTVMGFATTAAILVGVRVHHPVRRLPWQLVALCVLLSTIGIGILPKVSELAALAPTLTGAGYLAGFVGFVMLICGRVPGGDRGAYLDAAILASGTGVLIWAFGVAPIVDSPGGSSAATAAFFYPALIASAIVARVWFLEGPQRPATRLLVLLTLATNGITILDMLRRQIGYDTLVSPYLFAMFASVAFAGAAALHPSMALAPDRQRFDLRPISRRRIAALASALLVNPATLAIEAAGGRDVDPAPYVIGGVLIGVLVVLRLSDALGELGDSLREREFADGAAPPPGALRRLDDAAQSKPFHGAIGSRLLEPLIRATAGRPARRPR